MLQAGVAKIRKVRQMGNGFEAATDRKILNRLKRARGQLNAIIEKMEQGADCKEVVTQISAVSSAIDKAGFLMISAALKECLISDAPEADLNMAELERLFLTLS